MAGAGGMTIEGIEEGIVALSVELSCRMARWLALLAEFDARGGARRWGQRCTSSWLAWRCGISPRAARDHVRVARRLVELPLVREAFEGGQLSYSKVRALTRMGEGDDEAGLLELALTSSAAQVEQAIRSLRSAPSADLDTAQKAYRRRALDWWWQQDGSLRVIAALPPEEGAAFIDAVESGAEALYETDESGWRPPVGARRADALAEMMLSGSPRAQVVLHVDPESLGEVCSIEEGPAIPAETAQRMTCDGEIVDGHGRTRRVVSPALRRSLERRDGCCQFPGCSRRHGLHAHHIDHWVRGGLTDPDNLVLLCRFHHRLVHEDGFRVCRETHRFFRPDGKLIPDVPTPQAHPPPMVVAA